MFFDVNEIYWNYKYIYIYSNNNEIYSSFIFQKDYNGGKQQHIHNESVTHDIHKPY